MPFFLAATGAAVGLGNIWKFPYVVGENGGGAFVLVYLFFVFVIGLPVFMSEIIIGRRGRQSPYHSLYILASEAQHSRHWAKLGGLVTIAGFLILSYYSVVAGQVMAYSVRVASSAFVGMSADGVLNTYNVFRSNPETLLAWHTVFIVVVCIVVSRGVKKGLEAIVKITVPALVIMLLLLMVYAIYNHSFLNGASYLFDFDFKKLIYARDVAGSFIIDSSGSYQFTFKGILMAMGHAFFTLGLSVGAMMVYGVYLDRDISIGKTTFFVAIADTSIALLAGLAIFPIVFAYGLSAAQGPSLVFTTLPIAFGAMYFGNVIGSLFFLTLFFAALTSAIALLEPSVVWLIERSKMTRVQAVVWAGGASWFVGIISVFAVSGANLRDTIFVITDFFSISDIDLGHRIFNLTGFQVIDGIVTLVLLPVGGLLIAVFVGWIMSAESSRYELNAKNPWVYTTWRILVRYISPALILVIFAAGLFEWVNKYLLYQPVL
ncbi:MAG: sodium-dependent transporter [Gammaproteobacteria bacterium]|nr:sodium-dependent transporter [Gammaproteobacteria bacterium]